jgi:hypothetical protein
MNDPFNELTSIDPAEIEPLHEVPSQARLDALTAGMKENGWQGLPLLVIEGESGYLAWTGSHRIPAAIGAGLSLVPCYVIHEHELLRRGFDPVVGHVMDYERLQILKKIGDPVAIRIMRQEDQLC